MNIQAVHRLCHLVVVIATVSTAICDPPRNIKWIPDSKLDTPEALKTEQGELTINELVSNSAKFLSKLGYKVDGIVPKVHRNSSSISRGKSYMIKYSKFYHLSVRSTDGKVSIFNNSYRLYELNKGMRKAAIVRYRTKLDTQIYAHKIAKALGIDTTHELSRLAFHGGGMPNDPETNNAPQAEVMFEQKAFGYRFRDWWNSYEMRIDLTDGAVITYNYKPEHKYLIESRTAKITLAQAKEKVALIQQKFYIGRYTPSDMEFRYGYKPQPSTRPSELMYVCPNGVFGGLDYKPSKATQKLRLAWVINYPLSDQIWIDAADGKVLGGKSHIGID